MIDELLSATMAAAFIYFPALMLIGAGVFTCARLIRAGRRKDDVRREWALSKHSIRDPVTVGVLLVASGIVVVSFITGRVRFGDYIDLITDSVDASAQAATDWNDPLSSESITFKGGILILFVSAAIAGYALLGHFRSRWREVERVRATERLG